MVFARHEMVRKHTSGFKPESAHAFPAISAGIKRPFLACSALTRPFRRNEGKPVHRLGKARFAAGVHGLPRATRESFGLLPTCADATAALAGICG